MPNFCAVKVNAALGFEASAAAGVVGPGAGGFGWFRSLYGGQDHLPKVWRTELGQIARPWDGPAIPGAFGLLRVLGAPYSFFDPISPIPMRTHLLVGLSSEAALPLNPCIEPKGLNPASFATCSFRR